MTTSSTTRRDFIKLSTMVAGSYPLIGLPMQTLAADDNSVPINWLQKPVSDLFPGITTGVFWPPGKVNRQSQFMVSGEANQKFESQSWPLAYWPDGSLKWTAHAFDASIYNAQNIQIMPSRKKSTASSIKVNDSANRIIVDTGTIQCTINKKGKVIVESISRANKPIVKGGELVLLEVL